MFVKKTNLVFQSIKQNHEIICPISFIFSEFEEILYMENPLLTLEDRKYLKDCSPPRKHSFLLGRYALYQALNQKEKSQNIEVAYGCFGQPLLKKSDKKVCLSHSGKLGVSATYPKEILLGIDHEFQSHSTNLLPIDTVCSKQEIKLISSLGLPVESTKLAFWTTKEALAKALQTGFGVSLETLEVETLEELSPNLFDISFRQFKCFKALTWLGKNLSISLVYPENFMLILTKSILKILRYIDQK